MSKTLRKRISIILACVMVLSLIQISPKQVLASTVSASDVAAEDTYGLQSNIQDGVILHCWDWSFANIEANMANIAAAGYSAIQTSPIQQAKESTVGLTNSVWWLLYQPVSFSIDNTGNSALGTKAEFESMVETAHSYGVKVIVDIVANHTANSTGYDIASNVDSDIKDNASSTYHSEGFTEISDYTNRYRVTHYSMGGLPDLNTENSIVQSKVLGLLEECIDSGVDGFRFDAAKHISVPAEGSDYTFWTNTLEVAKEYASTNYGKEIYAYGEILDSALIDISGYTDYMSVTDNGTSSCIMYGVYEENAANAATSYYQKGESADKAVLWPESHDTYSNDSAVTTAIDQQVMDKTWALEASRADATALYYVRTPYRDGTFGSVHTYSWEDTEVVEANKFHNYFVGTTEYLGYNGNIAYNVRDGKGIVLVNCGGTNASVSFSISATGMTDGTYTDQITGNTFTVSSGYISGNIGSTGVAVVYNPEEKDTPTPTISTEGGTFSSDTLTLTLGLSNATSGTYKIGDGNTYTYTSSTDITIGSDMESGDSVVVYLTATDGSTTTTKSYTFTKKTLEKLPAVEDGYKRIFFKNTSGWSGVTAYSWISGTTTSVANWPGTAMTLYDSENGIYYIDINVDSGFNSIIFSNSGSSQTDDLTIPADDTNLYTYSSGQWSTYTYNVESEEEESLDVPFVYGVSKSDKSATISWEAVDGATSYQLYKYFASSGTIQKSKVVTDTTATFYNLTAGKTYRYIVQPISDTAECDNVSKEYAIDVKVGAPTTSSPLVSASFEDTYVQLSWDAVDNADTYYIYKYYQSSKKLVASKTTKNTSVKFYSIESGKNYRYLVSTKELVTLTNYDGTNVISIRIP